MQKYCQYARLVHKYILTVVRERSFFTAGGSGGISKIARTLNMPAQQWQILFLPPPFQTCAPHQRPHIPMYIKILSRATYPGARRYGGVRIWVEGSQSIHQPESDNIS